MIEAAKLCTFSIHKIGFNNVFCIENGTIISAKLESFGTFVVNGRNRIIMKKITLFSFLLLLAGLSNAQEPNIYIDPDSHNVHFDIQDLGDAVSYVNNPASVARNLRWVRMVDNQPASWYTSVCDINNCYSPFTSTMDFTLNAGVDGLMRLTIVADVPGTANYRLVVFDPADSANVNATMYVAAYGEDNTGLEATGTGTVLMYPNPAKDFLNVGFSSSLLLDKAEIFNIVGQKLVSVEFRSTDKVIAIPVSDLKKGMYFIRLYSHGKEVMTKTFSKE